MPGSDPCRSCFCPPPSRRWRWRGCWRGCRSGGRFSRSAELSGIAVDRVVIVTHVLSGVLAGAAGMVAVARLQLGQPTIGDDWLIPSFAAPVIGGAALSGGHASVAGTVCGVALVALIAQGLVLFRVDPYFVQLLLGLLILTAVGLSRLRAARAA